MQWSPAQRRTNKVEVQEAEAPLNAALQDKSYFMIVSLSLWYGHRRRRGHAT
jgi:hypothetical protein